MPHLLTGNRAYGSGVAAGMDYLLGRNGLGHSYVTGYSHRLQPPSAHPAVRLRPDPAFPPPPPGAPNSRPHPDFPHDERLTDLAPQLCYLDEPSSEVTNDICIRWNAPLVYVSSFLNLSAERSACGISCGAGNGRTLAWTPYDNECCLAIGHWLVAEQTGEG